jgi:LAO/AO transport system kinase
VGQSEYEVAAMVDFFLVLMIPNAGDELQGIKRGIMELADALVINKADGESINLAQRTKSHYQNAFHLIKHGSFWNPRVETCSALQKERIGDIWEMICDYQKAALENDAFFEKRALQNSEWLNKLIHEMLEMRLNQNPQVQSKMPGLQKAVEDNTTTPYNAAKQIVDLL